ncbi:MAG: ATP-binding protein [Chloroflexota bacterium]
MAKADEIGLSIRELRGGRCYETFFNRNVPCEHCLAAQMMSDEIPRTWSVKWRGEDHLPREWDVNAYPIPGGNQLYDARAVVVWQDRTEERRLEQSLLQAGKLAAIGQLAAGVAHEINNPLTAINANAEMLKMFIDGNEDTYDMVDIIHTAGVRAAKVVKGLLDFARDQQYSFRWVEVNESIQQSLDLVIYQLNTARVEIVKEFDDDVAEIQASAEHLKSVWINIMINARDAMQESGTEAPQLNIISRRTASQKDWIEVVFSDNGPGISEEKAQHIFEPFYTTKDPGKGTGLGLATCLRIIEQHHGTIEMISPPGQGTTFIIRLPIFQPKES